MKRLQNKQESDVMNASLSTEKVCQELGASDDRACILFSSQKRLSLSQNCFITASTDICDIFYGLVIKHFYTIHWVIWFSEQQCEDEIVISPSLTAKHTGSDRSSAHGPRVCDLSQDLRSSLRIPEPLSISLWTSRAEEWPGWVRFFPSAIILQPMLEVSLLCFM